MPAGKQISSALQSSVRLSRLQPGARSGHRFAADVGLDVEEGSVSSQAGSHGLLRNCSGKKRTQAESSGHDVWSHPSMVQ